MSSIVEFVVRMKDMMSSDLGKLSGTSQSAFSSMARNAASMNSRNKILGSSFTELSKKIKEVETTIKSSTIPSTIANARRELASLQRQSGRHSGNLGGGGSSNSGGMSVGGMALGSMLGGAAVMAGSAIIGAVTGGIASGISKSMQKEQDITGLSTFIGKKGASEAYNNIQKDADATPFNTASLMQVNRALISAGTNAKDAREDSMNLANAVSAVGGGNDILSRMAANMQQIKTVGKATAMDIRQFGMAGINIYEMLSKSTGKSIAQVKEMDVTYNDLAKSLAIARSKGGIYQGALEAQGKTMAGKWNTFQDKIGHGLSNVASAFSPIINKILDIGIAFGNSILPFLQKMKPNIDHISANLMGLIHNAKEFFSWMTGSSTSVKVFEGGIVTLTAAIVGYQAVLKMQALWTGVVTGAQNLLNIAMNLNPIGIVVMSVAALAAGFVVAYKRFDAFRGIVDGTWAALKTLGSNIKDTFLNIPNMVITAFSQIPMAIKNAFSGIGDLFSAIFDGDFSKVPTILKRLGTDLLKTNPVTGFGLQVTNSLSTGVASSFLDAQNKSLAASKLAAQKEAAEKLLNKSSATPSYFADLTRFKGSGSGSGIDSGGIEKNKARSKAAGDAITGGGARTVNITLGKFFDTIQFTTLNNQESAAQIEKTLMELMGRILYNGAKIA